MSEIKNSIESMTEVKKRVRIHDSQVVLKLPSSVKALVSRIAGERGVSDATVIREAMAEYLTKRGYNR